MISIFFYRDVRFTPSSPVAPGTKKNTNPTRDNSITMIQSRATSSLGAFESKVQPHREAQGYSQQQLKTVTQLNCLDVPTTTTSTNQQRTFAVKKDFARHRLEQQASLGGSIPEGLVPPGEFKGQLP